MELVTPGSSVVVIGEGMLELSRSGSSWHLGYGGDTLNTAIHLARMGCGVSYMTALGSDPFSQDLRHAWSGEGLDTSLVLTSTERQPGLYAIRTDDDGERSFHYWRQSSAAKQMFELPGCEVAIGVAAQAQLLIFSLISLAILPPSGRERLLRLAQQVRSAGGSVAFDGNYRDRLWGDREEARQLRDQAIAFCDIGLPTLADEQAMSGELDARLVADHWHSLGADEVVVKLGADGCFIDGQIVPIPAHIEAVDTSGAGDAFNAGYLARRLAGGDQSEAALAGHRLAAWVVSRRGAIPARDSEAPYAEPRDVTAKL